MNDQPDRLFDVPPRWAEHWADMPEFVQGDTRPVESMNVYFASEDDRREFLQLVGAPVTRRAGIWYPYRPPRVYDRPAVVGNVPAGRYPVYVVSKGRADSRLTSRSLEELGIDYRIVIEPQEAEDYAEHIDAAKILTLPFSNLGQGSIPARNWIWDHAVESGARRHWILDDNIAGFARLNRNETRKIYDENPLIPVETFVDRYDNVALAGLEYRGLGNGDKDPRKAPFRLNTRVYSCILINHALPMRWRGTYNEDTDLSLRALKDGWATVLFHAYTIGKAQTGTMGGGNADLYAGDGRRKMAESLREQHPDVVTIVEKWGRVQHLVDYSPFKHNPLNRWARADRS